MHSIIKYRIAARTEAAGKYSPDAPQEGNEDNYGLICNIAQPAAQPDFDEVVDLGEMGLLMFVADGMGGHNAGEVASKIAVDTVAEAFSSDKVSSGIAVSHEARSLYMEGVIREADKRIRAFSKQNKECEGMGSTLIIAWLVGNELSVSWCGDSRCYVYRPTPAPRISMISEDHSYVQELVQRGVIPYEATFAHPRGNVVTRCLGGGGELVEPESRRAFIGKGDIVILCSDGLSGVLFDDGRLFDGQPISEENICDVISAHRSSLRECLQELFAAAERQNWYDNVTVVACEVVEGPDAPSEIPGALPSTHISPRKSRSKRWVAAAAIVLLLVAGGLFSWWYMSQVPTCDSSCDLTALLKYDQQEGVLWFCDTSHTCCISISDSTGVVVRDTIRDGSRFRLPSSFEHGKKYYVSAVRLGCEPCTPRRIRFTYYAREKAEEKRREQTSSQPKAPANLPKQSVKLIPVQLDSLARGKDAKHEAAPLDTPDIKKELKPYNPPSLTIVPVDSNNNQ